MRRSVPPRIVPRSKLTDYLLNLAHEVGSSKASFFQTFGFSVDQLDVMTTALIEHADRNSIEQTSSSAWGVTYVVRCNIATPDGRDPCIRTVWIVPPGEATARLVKAYPA